MESTPLFLAVYFSLLYAGSRGSARYLHQGTTQVIDEIRHSVSAIKTLPLDVQLKARLVYYDGLRYSFAVSTAVAAAAVCTALLARAQGLRSTK
jgi:hypothetical protein